jgi:hypothetical protein
MANPTPKLDALRAMRERNFEAGQAKTKASLAALREKVAAVPVKKVKKVKPKGGD